MSKQLEKILKNTAQFVVVLALIMAFSGLDVYATSSLPGTSTELFKTGGLPVPSADDSGQAILKNVVFSGLGYLKTITAVLGILFITLLGYKLVSEGANEEEVTKAKKGLTYVILAFVMISMSEDIGKIFDMSQGSILQNPQQILQRVRLFDNQVEIIITFMKYFLGAFATLMMVRAGAKLVTAGGDEEEQTNQKKALLYTAGALVLIFVADIFINKVFYKVNKNVYSGITGVHPKVDAKEGVEQIVGITNFIVSFVGPVAILFLMAGALMYVTAAGEEEKLNQAKRLIMSAVIGILLIYGAFAIVNTVISGSLADMGAIEDGSSVEAQPDESAQAEPV